jgi:phytoene dehydrogenase-like protein
MANQKSIIIIGAGVAGLCAGIYAQMNGYRTKIFEKHKIPGGLVTAWRRKGYLIDLCIHWLVGSGPGIHLHRYWKEVGLLEGREFYYHDRYAVFHGKDGQEVSLFCDPDRLEKHWLEISPQDAPAIHEMVEGLHFGIRFSPPLVERYESGFLRWMKFVFGMLPLMGQISKWQKTTVSALAKGFQSPLLQEALINLWSPDFSALFMFATLGFMYKKQAAYPYGGSLPLALALEKRFKQLGGKVFYQSKVKKIQVED